MFSTTHIALARRVQWHDGTLLYTQDVVEEVILTQYVPCVYIMNEPEPCSANGQPWNYGAHVCFPSGDIDQEPSVIQDHFYEDAWNRPNRNFRIKKSNFYSRRYQPYDLNTTRNARAQNNKSDSKYLLNYDSDKQNSVTVNFERPQNNTFPKKLNATLIGQRGDEEQNKAAELCAETDESELKNGKHVETDRNDEIEMQNCITAMNSMENYLLQILDDDEGEACSEHGGSLQTAPERGSHAHGEPFIKQTLFPGENEQSNLAQESGEEKHIYNVDVTTNNLEQSSDEKGNQNDETCSEETDANALNDEWEAKCTINEINAKECLNSFNEHEEETLTNSEKGSWEASTEEDDDALDSSLGLIEVSEALPMTERGEGLEGTAESDGDVIDWSPGLQAAGEEALPTAPRAVSLEDSAERGDVAGGRWWSRAARVLRRRCGLFSRRRDASAVGRASWRRLLCCCHNGGDD